MARRYRVAPLTDDEVDRIAAAFDLEGQLEPDGYEGRTASDRGALSPGEEFEDECDVTGGAYGYPAGGTQVTGDGVYTLQLWLSTEHRPRGMTATTNLRSFRWVRDSHPVLFD